MSFFKFSNLWQFLTFSNASYDVTPFKTIMEKGQDQSPGETFLMTKKKMKKGVSKDLSAETFWADIMSYIVLITKAKEENPNWAPKKLLSELNLGYAEITVKSMPPLYFYNSDLGLSTPFILLYPKISFTEESLRTYQLFKIILRNLCFIFVNLYQYYTGPRQTKQCVSRRVMTEIHVKTNINLSHTLRSSKKLVCYKFI